MMEPTAATDWIEPQATAPAQPVGRPRLASATFSTRAAAITWIVIVALLLAALAILPRELPGEMSDASMTPLAVPSCAGCPPADAIVAAGLLRADGREYLNVAFAGAPRRAVFAVQFAGYRGSVTLSRLETSDTWMLSRASDGTVPISGVGVGQRNTRAVFAFPPSMQTSAVTIAGGPAIAIPVQPAPGVGLNVVDLVLVVIVGLAAAAGWRLGLIAEMPRTLRFAAVLVLTWLVYRLLLVLINALFSYSRNVELIAFALVIGGIGLCVYLFSARFVESVQRWLARVDRHGSPGDRLAGVIVDSVTTALVLAMFLSLLVDLVAIRAIGALVRTSITGHALVALWHWIFAAS